MNISSHVGIETLSDHASYLYCENQNAVASHSQDVNQLPFASLIETGNRNNLANRNSSEIRRLCVSRKMIAPHRMFANQASCENRAKFVNHDTDAPLFLIVSQTQVENQSIDANQRGVAS